MSRRIRIALLSLAVGALVAFGSVTVAPSSIVPTPAPGPVATDVTR